MNMVGGETPQYHAWQIAASQSATDVPEQCHAVTPSLLLPTF